MDKLTRQHRSWNMSRIRSADTKPEILVRSLLHRMGFRFKRISSRKLPGRPDIVLPKHKIAIFVHGCFWHRHRGCKYAYTPKSNLMFWRRKFTGNVKRDRTVLHKLRGAGWNVAVIWECETSDPKKLAKRLAQLVASSTPEQAAAAFARTVNSR